MMKRRSIQLDDETIRRVDALRPKLATKLHPEPAEGPVLLMLIREALDARETETTPVGGN